MNRRERLAPWLAVVAVLGVGLVVILMLRSATDDGIDALEDGEARAGLDHGPQLRRPGGVEPGIVAALGARPWELTEGSAADQAVLDTFAVDPQARSGMFLVDENDVITSGVLLQPGMLGSELADPGWPAAKEALATRPAAVLPVTPTGVTTDLPTYAFAIAIPGADARHAARRSGRRVRIDRGLDVQPGDPGARRRRRLLGRVALPGQQRGRRRHQRHLRPRRARGRPRHRGPRGGSGRGRGDAGLRGRRADRRLDRGRSPRTGRSSSSRWPGRCRSPASCWSSPCSSWGWSW